MFRSRRKKRLFLLPVLVIFSLVFEAVKATAPTAMYNEPSVLHNVWGNNSPPCKKNQKRAGIYLSPFYTTIPSNSGARDAYSNKVPAGDRLGRWNMLGLLFDPNPPVGVAFDGTNFPTLFAANTNLKLTGQGGLQTIKDWTDPSQFAFTPSLNLPVDLNDGLFSTKFKYHKVGVRGGFYFTSEYGVGFEVKSGVVEQGQESQLNDQTGVGVTPPLPSDLTNIQEFLMNPSAYKPIFAELGYTGDLDSETLTAAEDTHIQLHWTYPIALMDYDKTHAVDVIPYIAIGVWIPTGRSQDQNDLLSLSTGNDGFTGFTVEGAINIDFLDTLDEKENVSIVQFGMGGAVTFFDSRELSGFRVPTNVFQRGVIPWSTDVRRRLGTVWNFYFDLKTLFFLDGLTCYSHYVYTQHEKDHFGLQEEDPTRAAAFEVGIPLLEILSKWRSQDIFLGLDYEVTPNLHLGFAAQTQITGMKVYRPVTLIGQVNFTF